MYNKLFTKILDSSIWLEPTHTRLVWLTLIAAMDEDGFAQFASVANLAHRARIPEEDTQAAVDCLSSPDPNSSDSENDGRRIEHVPGGWIILNAAKYRDLVTRAVAREKTRLRVEKFRDKQRGNGDVTQEKRSVTPSRSTATATATSEAEPYSSLFEEFWRAYPRRVGKQEAYKAWNKQKCDPMLPKILSTIRKLKITKEWTKDGGQFIPHPSTWIGRGGWDDEPGVELEGSKGRLRPQDVPTIIEP